MKNCLSCGAENVDDRNNCMQCGKEFGAVSSVNDMASADDVSTPEKTRSDMNVSETNFDTEQPVEPVQQPLYGKQGKQPQNQPYTQGQPNAQGPYGGQPYGGGTADVQKMVAIGKAKRKGKTALTMTIISIFFLWFPPIAIILSFLACINGIVAIGCLKKLGEKLGQPIVAVIVAVLVTLASSALIVKAVKSDEFRQIREKKVEREKDKKRGDAFRDEIKKGMDGLDEEERERALKEFEKNFGKDFRQYYQNGMVQEQMAKGYIDLTLLQK